MAKITKVRSAGENAHGEHQVVTVVNGGSRYRQSPCSNCPWRTDAVGEFPADAFRQSAHTAYDMAEAKFACHQSGTEKPATCAGFLLCGADHNLAVRLMRMQGKCLEVQDGGLELHTSYRAMAVANGVSPDDPALKYCRD